MTHRSTNHAYMDALTMRAIELGADSRFGVRHSTLKNKRFVLIYDSRFINFGSKHGKTYIDHQDPIKLLAWHSRHSKIKNRFGEYVIYDKRSPSFWSSNLLWA